MNDECKDGCNNLMDIVLNPRAKYTCDGTIYSGECGCKYVIHTHKYYGYKRNNKVHYCEACETKTLAILDKPLKAQYKFYR